MSSGLSALNIFPTINPERATIEHRTFPDTFRSAQSGFYRSKRRWGMWSLVYDWANLEQDQAKIIIAQFNRFISADLPFKIYDITRPETTGHATQLDLQSVYALGTNYGQRGQQIVLRGLPPGKICFLPGDLIGGSRNGEMYEVAEIFQSSGTTLDAPGSGTGTVQLTNFIRKPLGTNVLNQAVNEPMFTQYVPVKVMGRMQAPDVSGGMPIYSFSVEMSETW